MSKIKISSSALYQVLLLKIFSVSVSILNVKFSQRINMVTTNKANSDILCNLTRCVTCCATYLDNLYYFVV